MNPSPYPAPFTSAHGRVRIVKLLLIVGAVVTGMSLLAEALSFAFPPLSNDQELGDNLIGAAMMLVIFLLAVLDPINLLDDSGLFLWAVGSFFVPFVNLVVPYRAVREVWQKSRLPQEALLSETDPPASFPIWWLFWLIASFVGNTSMRTSFNENVSESTATMISIIASALYIVAAIFAYQVVNGIDKRQEETSGKAKLGKFSGPPPPPANLPMSDVLVPTP